MARLIDGGPDRVEFFPEVATVDEYGSETWGLSDTPIVLDVELQRVSSEEAEALQGGGGPVRTLFRFNTSRALPASPNSVVKARGRTWEVMGEPTIQGRSARTRHTRVLMRALTGGDRGE